MIYTAQCHCGKIGASFETKRTPAELGVRTCQCDFCRRHGAMNISDPEGEIVIDAAAADLHRYRFALRTADFLICKRCGVYVAAVMGAGDNIRSTLNIAGLRVAAFLDAPQAPIDYGAETPGDRVARRRVKWTPTRFLDPALAVSKFGPH